MTLMFQGGGSPGLSYIASEFADTTTTSLVVNVPSHNTGDKIYVFIGSESASAADPITTSDGLTNEASRTGNVTYVWSKVAGGSEPATYTFTLSSASDAVAIAVSLRNFTSDVIGAISATDTAAGVTMTNAGILLCFSNKEGGAITSGPSGMTVIKEHIYSGHEAGLYRENVSSGATGIRQTTFSGGTNENSILVGVW